MAKDERGPALSAGGKTKSARRGVVDPEVLRPAVRVDANYLRNMALGVRGAVSDLILLMVLESLEGEASQGRLHAGIWLGDFLRGLDLAVRLDELSLGEALVVSLRPLGFEAQVAKMARRRVGMNDEELMLQITWREVGA